MKNITTSLVTLSLGLVFGANATAAVGKYRLIDLGAATGTNSYAKSINNNGQVVGNGANGSGQTRPWMFNVSTSALTMLPIPSDFPNGTVTDINDSGKMVGYGQKTVSGTNRWRGLYWSDLSVPVQITPFNALTTGDAYLLSINDYGLCGGMANGQMYSGVASSALQAMTYNAPTNSKSFRGTLDGAAGSVSRVNALNNNGTQVGSANSGGGNVTAYRNNSGLLFAIGVPAGATSSAANAINNYNEMAGTYNVSASQTLAFYKNDYAATITIPRLSGASGDDSNSAASINTSGYVVGDCEIGNTNRRGYLWNGSQVYDLNSITANLGSNTIKAANHINDKQWIAGSMSVPGQGDRAMVLRPLQVIQGTLNYNDFVGSVSSINVDWEFVDAGNNVLDSGTFKTNILKMYTIETIAQGEGTLRIKPSHWLSQSVPMDLTNAWTTISKAFTFDNGDCDGDNIVSVFDYIILSDAFDSTVGSAGYSVGADLDGDGTVSVFDYIILSDHFDEQGS